jgi:glyoxylase-like metal-dependent hydrolase (beta-lactamase superfamily II)
VRPVVEAGLVDLVESDHVVCDEIRLEPTPGHTQGHHSVAIASAGARAVITGDMAHHPVQIAHPTVCCRGDYDSDQSTQTRWDAFARWEAERTLVIGSHFVGPGAGYLAADGDGWRLLPGG